MESFETLWTLGDCLELGSFRNINGVPFECLEPWGGKICLWPPCRDAGIENNVVGDEQQQIWIFATWYNWRFGKFGLCFLVMLWYWHGEVADSWRDHQRKAPDLRPRRRFSDPGDSSFQGAIWSMLQFTNSIFANLCHSQLMFVYKNRSSQLHHFEAACNFFQLQVRWICTGF